MSGTATTSSYSSLDSCSYTKTMTRESTRQQTAAAHAKSPVKSRSIHIESHSYSYIRELGHDCLEVDRQSTVLRTIVRLSHSLFRFSLAYAFECKTLRGKTVLNGSNAKCGGCHALHAAFTPKLRDNMLEITADKVRRKRFHLLKPFEQEYLRRRLELSKQDEEQLSSARKRASFMDALLKKLSYNFIRGSFLTTQINFSRNGTFENPISSNRIDCKTESLMRPYEDSIAEDCSCGVFTPSEALILLQKRYKSVLEDMLEDMKCDLLIIDLLHKAFSRLIACEQELALLDPSSDDFEKKFAHFHQLVERYQRALDLRFKDKLKGTPSFKAFKTYLETQQPHHWVNKLCSASLTKAKTIYLDNKRHFKQPADFEPQFQKATAELSRRMDDVKIQLSLLDHTPEEVDLMLSHLFGRYKHTPTKDEMALALVTMIPTSSVE